MEPRDPKGHWALCYISTKKVHEGRESSAAPLKHIKFSLKSHNRHPTAPLWGQAIGCLLWVLISERINWYYAVPLLHGKFSLNLLQCTPHSSRMRVRYGCLLWVPILIYVMSKSLCWMRYLIALQCYNHYYDVILSTMVSQITSLKIVYTTIYSGADQRKQPSSVSLAFVRGIHWDWWIPRRNGQ